MPRPPNFHRPLATELLNLPGAELRRMFGAEAIYVDGVILLVLADDAQPWNGLLFPAERDQHAAILAQFPFLVPHEVLPKWLYLSAEDDRFESRATALLDCVTARDPRFGVLPKPKKRRAIKGAESDGAPAAKPSGSAKGKKRPPAPAPDDGRPPHLR